MNIRSVTIIHEELGEQSIKKLKYLFADMLQLHLSRLIFKNLQEQNEILDSLMQELISRGKYLQKLTLAKMNLSATVHHVIELIGRKDHLQMLNLSQTKLGPRELARMSEAILQIILSNL